MKNILVNIYTLLIIIFRRLFGSIHWEAPLWLISARTYAKRFLSLRTSNPRQFWRWTLGTCTLLIAGPALYHWYSSLPEPNYVKVSSNKPSALPLEKDALPNPLRISFSDSAAPLDKIGKEISSLISIKPAHKGVWKWESDRVLVFTLKAEPLSAENIESSQDWIPGQTYRITFEPGLVTKNTLLKKNYIEFKAQEFSASIDKAEFYEDPRDPKIKRAAYTVSFSHPINKSDFEKRVTLLFDKVRKKGFQDKLAQALGFQVAYNPFAGEAYVQSEVLAVPEFDSKAVLRISEGIRSSRGGEAAEKTVRSSLVHIPSIYTYFKINSTVEKFLKNDSNKTERVHIIETSTDARQEVLSDALELWALPNYFPAHQGMKRINNYRWHSTVKIGPEVLQHAEKLDVKWIPTELEYSKIHSLKYKVSEGTDVFLRIRKGIKSFGGYILGKDFQKVWRTRPYPKEIRVLHDGAILSLSGSRKLSVFTQDVDAVQFEVSRVLPNAVQHLINLSGGKFKQPQFNSSYFNFDNVSERKTEIRYLPYSEPGEGQYTAFDFTKYMEGAHQNKPQLGLNSDGLPLQPVSDSSSESPRGLFFLKVQNWNQARKRAEGVFDVRLVLVTDLGILVKNSFDKSQDVFVQSIENGLPVEGAEVSILGKNGLPVMSKRTGADGHVKFPDLSDFKREKTPSVYIAAKGSDYSFLPYDRRDRQLNFSRFDVGGIHTTKKPDALQAYLFSDRGIYRPGDEFRIGLVVKPSNWASDIKGVPLEIALTDARGIEIDKKRIQLSKEGFEEYSYRTFETSPTGSYQVNLYIVKDNRRRSLLGSTSVRIEEFLPDRMRISTGFSTKKQKGWISPEELRGSVHLENLFGKDAVDHRVSAELSLQPSFPSFSLYKDYTFFDPLRAEKRFDQDLEDQKTDSSGNAVFDFNLSRFDRASYYLTFLARGF